jgi:hypothetical protein
MVIQGYHYNLKRQLVPVEASHQQDQFKNPKIRFNLYGKDDRTIRGQVSLLTWQDGATIICSVMFDPRPDFRSLLQISESKWHRSPGQPEQERLVLVDSSNQRRRLHKVV